MRINEANTVVVETLGDIRRVTQEFMPGNKQDNPDVHATITVSEDRTRKTYELSAPTGCTYREMLIEGFEVVRKRLEAMAQNTKTQLNIQPINVDGHMWLDDLIARRLAGSRDGLRVRWDLAEGTFFFDPFAGKLTKCTSSTQ